LTALALLSKIMGEMSDDYMPPMGARKLLLVTQTQQVLRALVKKGAYWPGEQLPSEKELAGQLGISRPALREAILNLSVLNLLCRKPGPEGRRALADIVAVLQPCRFRFLPVSSGVPSGPCPGARE